MSLAILSYEKEQASINAKNMRNRQRSWFHSGISDAEIGLLKDWGRAASWLPRQVIVPLVRQGISPVDPDGLRAIRHSLVFEKPQYVIRGGYPVAVGATGPEQTPGEPGGVQGVLPLLSAQQHGLRAGGWLLQQGAKAVAKTSNTISGLEQRTPGVGPAIERNQRQAEASSGGATREAVRYGFAGMQDAYGALQTAITRPWMGSAAIQQEIKQGSAPTGSPFDPGQSIAVQMHRGLSSGEGYLPDLQSPAVRAAVKVQGAARGTIGGHVATPGRLAAAAVVEPNTLPWQVLSGAVDLLIATKADPAAIALTKIGDVRAAQQIFDHTGAFTNGFGKYLHGPTLDQWVDNARNVTAWKQLADIKSMRRMDAFTKHELSAQAVADLVDTRTVDDVKGALRHHLTDTRTVPNWGYNLSDRVLNNRWLHDVPSHFVNVDDADGRMRNVDSLLRAVKVDPKVADRIMYDTARATTPGEIYQSTVKASELAMRTELENRKVPDEAIKDLTRFFQKRYDRESQYAVDEVGNTPWVTGLTNDGQAVEVGGPILASEMLGSTIGLPDYRALARSSSQIKKVYEIPGVSGSITLADWFTQRIFKPAVLMRGAWTVRVVGEEQIRMATAGLDSMFRHPASFISWAIGNSDKQVLERFGKGGVDSAGIPFGQMVHDQYNKVLGHAGQEYAGPEQVGRVDQIVSKHWDRVNQGDRGFLRSWGDRLSHYHMDPTSRAVAKAAQDGDGFRGVQDAFWDGALKKEREAIVDGGGWRQHLATREGADAYIENVVWDQLHRHTGGNAELLDMVANGGNMRYDMRLQKPFLQKLAQLQKEGTAPEWVMGQAYLQGKPELAGQVTQMRDHFVEKMFNVLMSRPTNRLSRSPTFRQYYWKRTEELFPRLDPQTQEGVIRAAEDAHLGDVAKRMKKVSQFGDTTLEDADLVARSYALDETKRLLYDTTKKSQFMDAARIVFPFGEAWKEVVGVWARLMREEPQVFRRGEQLIQSARGSGFFYKDPQDGVEYVNIPIAGQLTKHLVGVPWDMRGRVNGLNIAASGLPGVGPVLQIPAAIAIPDEPQWDGLRKMILPYGPPEDVRELILPGWAQRLQTTNWFKDTKVGDAPGAAEALGFLRFLFPQTQDQKRIFMGAQENVMKTLLSTGAYNSSDPEDVARLVEDSRNKAMGLYFLRSMTQAISPTAPQFLPKIKAKDSKLYELYGLAQDYRDLVDKHQGDFDKATTEFVDRYGEKAYLATNPNTQAQVYMPPTSKQQSWWASQHKKFNSAYGMVAGFFGPTSSDHDANAYRRAVEDGQIKALSPQEWYGEAQHRLASWQYARMREKMGPNPTQEQRDALAQYKDALHEKYPTYDPEGAHGKDPSPENSRSLLAKAARDPEVKGTTLAKGITLYMDARAEAQRKLKAAGYNGFDSQYAAAPLRAWLRDIGSEIYKTVPQFRPVWDQLLYDEVSLDKEPTNG